MPERLQKAMYRRRILGYCAYCKDEILVNDEYVVEGTEIFHPECLEQKNTFYPWSDDEPEEE